MHAPDICSPDIHSPDVRSAVGPLGNQEDGDRKKMSTTTRNASNPYSQPDQDEYDLEHLSYMGAHISRGTPLATPRTIAGPFVKHRRDCARTVTIYEDLTLPDTPTADQAASD